MRKTIGCFLLVIQRNIAEWRQEERCAIQERKLQFASEKMVAS